MISPIQISQIVSRIRQHFNPNKIILFGSYSTGTCHSESDLDLLIIKDKSLPLRSDIRKALSDFDISFDIIVKSTKEFEKYKDIIGSIIYPANKFGKVIYEA